jgi:hypothetical protein
MRVLGGPACIYAGGAYPRPQATPTSLMLHAEGLSLATILFIIIMLFSETYDT